MYRIGIQVEELMDNNFKVIFSITKACMDLDKLKDILKEFNTEITRFIEENDV